MKKFIAIEEGNGDYFIVNDLKELIEQMYEGYNSEAETSFYSLYKVIEIEGNFNIKELN